MKFSKSSIPIMFGLLLVCGVCDRTFNVTFSVVNLLNSKVKLNVYQLRQDYPESVSKDSIIVLDPSGKIVLFNVITFGTVNSDTTFFYDSLIIRRLDTNQKATVNNHRLSGWTIVNPGHSALDYQFRIGDETF